jgi:hypothetical protein
MYPHTFAGRKVRLQVSPGAYRGVWDCAVKTARVEGVPGFFRGLSSPMSAAAVTCSIQMFTYARIQELLLHLRGTTFVRFYGLLFVDYIAWNSGPVTPNVSPLRLHAPDYFVAGAITGGVEGFFYSPVSLMKSQMQAQIFRGASERHTTMRQCLKAVWSEHGVFGLFQVSILTHSMPFCEPSNFLLFRACR